jgi:hypothetical protein
MCICIVDGSFFGALFLNVGAGLIGVGLRS